METVAVIGAGVIGLTSAICLQEAGFRVSIFTKDLPQNTTSSLAGAIWWGYGEGKVRQWAERSLQIFKDEIERGIPGVKLLRLRDLYRHQAELPWFHADIPYCERISGNELNPPYKDGFVMDVPLTEPPLYLPYLLKRYQDNGGDIIQQEIHSLDEPGTDYKLIINCTGLAAGELAHDERVYPIRGQTAIVDAPDVQIGFMDNEHFTYILPRSDGVILGGVHQANQTHLTVDPADRDDIFERVTIADKRTKNRPIIKENVGLRPGRDTVRLEAERTPDDCLVIHNYGHAELGFTLSWGCAENVVQLAQEARS